MTRTWSDGARAGRGWARVVVAVATTAAAVSGCAGGVQPAAPSPTPSGTTASEPSGSTPATATASPTASPSSAVLTLGFDRLGPARLGMTMDEFGAALGMPVVPTESSGVTDPCWFERLGSPQSGLAVMSVEGRDGPVVRIDVLADGAGDVASLPRTDLGLGVGSTADEVRTAHAGHVEEAPHAYVDGLYLTVTGPDAPEGTAVVFETDGSGVVTSMRAGLTDPVAFVEGCA